jgi:DNA-binding IclR family transcriptional regulator
MAKVQHFHPTLWRTCRVLANQTRLRILQMLLREPNQTVTQVAARLNRPASLTSEYLRALEARGMLGARRIGSRVVYRPGSFKGEGAAPLILAALRLDFQKQARPILKFFKLATAFTHPRRIEIFRLLSRESSTLSQIKMATRMSARALQRNLAKLQSRGFIRSRSGIYTVAERSDSFGRELSRWAAQ